MAEITKITALRRARLEDCVRRGILRGLRERKIISADVLPDIAENRGKNA